MNQGRVVHTNLRFNVLLASIVTFSWCFESRLGRVDAADGPYPVANLLIEAKTVGDKRAEFLMIDARPRKDYDAGHVDGALWVDHDLWSKSFKDGKDVEGWAKIIGGLGIDGKKTVVVYGDDQWPKAARIWFIMAYWGVADVRLMNGGFAEWKNIAQPISTETHEPSPTRFEAKLTPSMLATKSDVANELSGGRKQIVDTRTKEEFTGEKNMSNPRAGCIPGSKSIPWSAFVNPESNRVRSAEEIKKLLDDAGVDLAKPSMVYCQSGGRAAMTMFILRLMGQSGATNYYGSFQEWSRSTDLPVEATAKAAEKAPAKQ
jgi:thiosulfate/3-mercaptopyruvate sulfurtransferase